jgi:UDP-N-acetylmuramate--alanine ligase
MISKKQQIRYVYLVGAGGIGMSALGRYFLRNGALVYGYDKTPTALTDKLQEEGMDLIFKDEISLLPEFIQNMKNMEELLVIYTPAIPENNTILNYFRSKQFNLKKRAEVLGDICGNHFTVAVAGTHGKTTTSTMLAHLLKSSGKHVTAFLGGVSTNYNTNFLLGGEDSIFVAEADEFDRSFLKLYPDIAVITSVSPDHLDIYGEAADVNRAYETFAQQVKSSVFIKQGTEINYSGTAKHYSYSIDNKASAEGQYIHIEDGIYHFQILWQGKLEGPYRLTVPGMHNVENAIAAISVCRNLDIPEEKLIKALASFSGVKRRFEYIVKTSDFVFIDDYAHHPEELDAAISTAKALYPDKKITGVFQPHLYSRTRDFMHDFARSLDQLDEIILLDIYPARELPIEGINSQALLKLCTNPNKRVVEKGKLSELLQQLKPQVLLTLGAGDIDALVEPVKNACLNQHAL